MDKLKVGDIIEIKSYGENGIATIIRELSEHYIQYRYLNTSAGSIAGNDQFAQDSVFRNNNTRKMGHSKLIRLLYD